MRASEEFRGWDLGSRSFLLCPIIITVIINQFCHHYYRCGSYWTRGLLLTAGRMLQSGVALAGSSNVDRWIPSSSVPYPMAGHNSCPIAEEAKAKVKGPTCRPSAGEAAELGGNPRTFGPWRPSISAFALSDKGDDIDSLVTLIFCGSKWSLTV